MTFSWLDKSVRIVREVTFRPEDTGSAAFFIYVIPVMDLDPGVRHHFKLSYNKSKYLVGYYIDGKRVFKIEFGRRLATDFDSYSQFKDLPGSENPNNLSLIQSHQHIVGGGLFTTLDNVTCHGNELVSIHDPSINPSEKVFGHGGKVALSNIVIGIN
jgi:hypothetical protein